MKKISTLVTVIDEYALVKGTDADGKVFYGTIPTGIIRGGKLTKELNGCAMMARETLGDAITARSELDDLIDWRRAHPDATEEEVIKHILCE